MCTPITFITGNPEKIIEIQEIIGSTFPRKLILRLDIDLPELQGEIEEIAIKKVLEATRYQTGPILCEDASLCFNALNGLPGPYVKWFQSKIGPCGLYRLLKGIKRLQPFFFTNKKLFDRLRRQICRSGVHFGVP